MNMQESECIQIPFSGESMWPLFDGNETLFVEIPREPISLSRKDIGALFIFKDHSEWLCHRYLGVKNNKHLFKGDYSMSFESFESPHVMGRVRGFNVHGQGYRDIRTTGLDLSIAWIQRWSIGYKSKIKKGFRYYALFLLWIRKRFFN